MQTSNTPSRPAYREIEVILKVAERCNLACDYCYYFFKGDTSFKDKPKRISRSTLTDVARFLAEGVTALGIPNVKLVFHGGEPLLLGKPDFEFACGEFRKIVGSAARLHLAVQTNGVLVDDAWMAIFERHGVGVGISIDGDAEINDRRRVDLRGRGSHERVARGIAAVKASQDRGGGIEPGLLTVLDAGHDVARLYRHFVDDLGSRSLSFLLPDCSHDEGIPDGYSAEDYGRVLCELFDLWAADQTVSVREVERTLAHFSTARGAVVTGRRNPVIVIRSDGELNFDDSYVPAQAWRDQAPKGHVGETSLEQWLSNSGFSELDQHYDDVPTGCRDCAWRNVCQGGDLENRYASATGFDNPSVFCEGLKAYHLHVTRHLASTGYPVELIMRKLGLPEVAA